MKSLMLLSRSMLIDLSMLSGTTTSKDHSVISARVKSEGLSFLTITLANYAEDLERALDVGAIGPGSFRSFGKIGGIPKLFSGILRQIFDVDGRLLSEPNIRCIRALRQYTRMYKKIILPVSAERKNAAVDRFIKNEVDLLSWFNSDFHHTSLYDDFRYLSKILWGELEHHFSNVDLIPRHGPGAVSQKESVHKRYTWSEWHTRLDPYFPIDAFAYHNVTAFLDECDRISLLGPDQERPVRIVLVPKTQKTERVIAIEPTCNQYTQQAVLSRLVPFLESYKLTRGSVNFTSQDKNRQLALEHSKKGILASIDLSDASDRVHSLLVHDMLASCPFFRGMVFACRSRRGLLPTGLTIQLQKFASMGSALCFPIEAMVFYTLCLLAEFKRSNRPINAKNILLFKKNIFVYGDDIFVPVGLVPVVQSIFEAFCLKVNAQKSFWTGKFRESCGQDAYDGVDVTSIYVRRMLPLHRRDVCSAISSVSLSNQLYAGGYETSAEFIRSYLNGIGLRFPVGTDRSGYVCYVRPLEDITQHRRCGMLHKPLVKAYVVEPRRCLDSLDGNQALTAWFLKAGDKPTFKYDYKHLGTGRLTFKRRWCHTF